MPVTVRALRIRNPQWRNGIQLLYLLRVETSAIGTRSLNPGSSSSGSSDPSPRGHSNSSCEPSHPSDYPAISSAADNSAASSDGPNVGSSATAPDSRSR